MAITSAICNSFKTQILTATHDFTSSSGDTFKLADWNGDLNGGQYHVIFIDMSASW